MKSIINEKGQVEELYECLQESKTVMAARVIKFKVTKFLVFREKKN